MEPAIDFDRGEFRGDGPRSASRSGVRSEPENLPLERIRRERYPALRDAGAERLPADIDASKPETTGGCEQDFRIRLILVVVAKTGSPRCRIVAAIRGILLCEDAE